MTYALDAAPLGRSGSYPHSSPALWSLCHPLHARHPNNLRLPWIAGLCQRGPAHTAAPDEQARVRSIAPKDDALPLCCWTKPLPKQQLQLWFLHCTAETLCMPRRNLRMRKKENLFYCHVSSTRRGPTRRVRARTGSSSTSTRGLCASFEAQHSRHYNAETTTMTL